MVAAILAVLVASVVFSYKFWTGEMISKSKNDLVNSPKDVKKISFIHWEYFPLEIFNKFSEEHPDIKVEFQQLNENYYPLVQRTRIASRSDISVMGVMESDYKDFVFKNYLSDLTGNKYLENYRPEVRERVRALTVGNREYAIAYKDSVYGVWYNKILFKKYNLEVPKTYEEFLTVCETLKKNGVQPLVMGARDELRGNSLFLLRFPELVNKDKELLERLKNKSIRWADPEVSSLLKEIGSFADKGYISKDSANLTYHQAFWEFSKGHAAMTIMGDWSINMASEDMEKICEPGVFPIPYGTDGDIRIVPGSYAGMFLGIFPESAHKEEANLLLDFLSRLEIAQLFTNYTMWTPTIKNVDTSRLKYYELWNPLRKLERFPPLTDVVSNDMQEMLGKGFRSLLIKEKTYEQLAQELQSVQDGNNGN